MKKISLASFAFLAALMASLAALLLTAGSAQAEGASQAPTQAATKGPIDITAEDALEWHQKERAYIARGKAVATRDKVTLRADTLTAFERDAAAGNNVGDNGGGKGSSSEIWRLQAEGNVTIRTDKQTVAGDKGLYDVDRKVAVMTGGNLRFTSGEDVVTARDSLEWWDGQRLAVARGSARAVRADRTVAADQLVAQLTENAQGQLDVSRIDAVGNVTITTRTDVATGSRAVYDLTRNVAVLEGPVRIKRDRGYLEGARGEVDFNTGLSRLLAGSEKRVRGLFVPESEKDAAQKGAPKGGQP